MNGNAGQAPRLATVEQQDAMARHIADAVRVIEDATPRFAGLLAKRIEYGFAAAIPEFTEPADALSLRYRIEVDLGETAHGEEPVTVVTLPWMALGLTVDDCNAEHANYKER